MPYVVRPGRSRVVARRAAVTRAERQRLVLAAVGSVRLSAYEVATTLNITFGYAWALLVELECEGLVRSGHVGRRRLWWAP
jgi:predicted Rossmann fold nucleotide-binding protein DprA/Smf involved in DNA uptake